MFNITPGEFLIIGVLALIVLGPERLPDMARSLGQMIHKLRGLTAGLQETVSSISDDPSMKPLKDLGELATRPRQKLAQFAAEAEAEERAERIAREREEMDRQQQELASQEQAANQMDAADPESIDEDGGAQPVEVDSTRTPDQEPADIGDDGPVADGHSDDEPTHDESTDDMPTDDESTHDEPTDDPDSEGSTIQ